MTHPHDRLSDVARARLGRPGHPTWETFHIALLLRAEVRRMRRQGDGPADEDLADIELQEDAA